MSILRNRQQESRSTLLRVLLISFFFMLLFTGLATQIFRLQITQHQHYKASANHNKEQTITIAPYRSDILDRNNKPLAIYKRNFYLAANRRLNDNDMKILKQNDVPSSNNEKKINDYIYAKLYNTHKLDHILKESTQRHYPYGASTSHIIGYTAKQTNSKTELSDKDSPYMIGKTGIEATYNEYIQGMAGQKINQLNAKRQIVRSIIENEPKRSMPLKLTIDAELQQYIFDQLSGLVGSVIVLDPNSGELLAGVSSPSFDPNRFNERELQIPQSILHNKPMFNRFSQALYPPASIVKPFIALNALNDNIIDPNTTIFDPGYYKINEKSKAFRNHKRNGHGTVDLHKALVVSNDPYFYDLAYKLGIDKLTDYLSVFKFGEKTLANIPHEASGIIPDKRFRQKNYKKWYAGQTVIAGIGQGDLLCTPLQLARATMLLANDGYDYPIHLLQTFFKPTPKIHHYKPEHRSIIINALTDVIKNGTARKIDNKPYSIAGKTGSAQVTSLDNETNYQSLPHHHKDHHLFIGFAPAELPSIVIVVVIEHQHDAVNIANKIFDWCWEHGLINST